MFEARIAALVQEPLKTNARRELAFAGSPSSSSSGSVDGSDSESRQRLGLGLQRATPALETCSVARAVTVQRGEQSGLVQPHSFQSPRLCYPASSGCETCRETVTPRTAA